jgi:hypothetical protein
MATPPTTLEHRILDFLFAIEKPQSIAVDTRGIFSAKYAKERGKILEITISFKKVVEK